MVEGRSLRPGDGIHEHELVSAFHGLPIPELGGIREKRHGLDVTEHQSLRPAVQALRAVVGRSNVLALGGRLVRELGD
jgi:hypothetical protein